MSKEIIIREKMRPGDFIETRSVDLKSQEPARKKVKVLELFAGSRSVGRQAEKMGLEVYSVDKFIKTGMDKVCGVEELTKEMILKEFGEPQIIWASPVCSVWSKLSWWYFWDKDVYNLTGQFIAKKPFAYESIEMVRKTIEIFSWFPNAVFFMENPEGMLQKHPVLSYFNIYRLPVRKNLVTYCAYGFNIRKPTQIWSNCKKWVPAPTCDKGDPCHISSPRRTENGLQSRKTSFERSKIPDQLAIEILRAALSQTGKKIKIKNSIQTVLFNH